MGIQQEERSKRTQKSVFCVLFTVTYNIVAHLEFQLILLLPYIKIVNNNFLIKILIHKMRNINKIFFLPLTMAADSITEPPSWKVSASDGGKVKSHHLCRDTQGNRVGGLLV